LLAVLREIPSRRLASRTDTPSLSTRRRNLLNVLTLITPDHLAEKFSSVAVNVAQFSV
jgi:hypothetical protein